MGRYDNRTNRIVAETEARIVAWLRGPFCQQRQHPEDQAYARFIANAIAHGDHRKDTTNDAN